MIRDLIETLHFISKDISYYLDAEFTEDDLINQCLMWETELFRARIKAERTINQ